MPRFADNGTISLKNPDLAQGFKLSLPATVEGAASDGYLFKEEAAISFISHVGAILELKSYILAGTRLRLSIDLPPGLDPTKKLKLVIKGTVVEVSRDFSLGGLSRVAVKFENRYVIEEKGDGREKGPA